MLPRCHPDSIASVDTIQDREKPLELQGKAAFDQRIGTHPLFRITLRLEYISFLADDNKLNRVEAGIFAGFPTYRRR